VTEAALPVVYGSSRFRDAVDAVKSAGRAVLAKVPMTLPWVQPAPFRILPPKFDISIRAMTHVSRGGEPIGQIASGSIVSKHCWILYEALNSNETPFVSKDFVVQWRVVNSDRDAINAQPCVADSIRQIRRGGAGRLLFIEASIGSRPS
jgi:hypothetical protein